MFLTVEQEQAIQEYLNNHDFHFRNQKGDAERKSQVLLENGFIEGVHFENTFTFEENVTETVSLGGRWFESIHERLFYQHVRYGPVAQSVRARDS